MAMIGNISVITVILKSQTMRHTPSDLFVLNLSIVNLIASIISLPASISTFLNNIKLVNSAWCISGGFITSVMIYVSIANLCIISLERYYYIKWPMHHKRGLTTHRTFAFIFVTWIQAIGLALPPLSRNIFYDPYMSRKSCHSGWQGAQSNATYVMFVAIWCFCVPLLLMLISHCGMFLVVRKCLPPIMNISSVSQTADSVKRRRSLPRRSVALIQRSAKSLFFSLVHLATFIVMWGPFFLVRVDHALLPQSHRQDEDKMMDVFVTWIGFSTFAVNPVLYGLMNREIRTELADFYEYMFCCDWLLRLRQEEETSRCQAAEEEDFLQFLGIKIPNQRDPA